MKELKKFDIYCQKFVQGSFLDESAGLKKKEENLIIATATPKAKLTSTASWNKKVTKLVYVL